MEKKNNQKHHSEDKEEEKKELIKTIETLKIDEGLQPSQLITQQQDPIVAIEKELRVKLDHDTKDFLRQEVADETSY
jgi:hypothetical protein